MCCYSSPFPNIESVAEWSSPTVFAISSLMLIVTVRHRIIQGRPSRIATTCRGCTYSLDGLEADVRCPECGVADARRRTGKNRYQSEVAVHPSRVGVYFLLAACLFLTSWIRHLILTVRHEPQGYAIQYHEWFDRFTLGWVNAPLLAAACLAWVLARRRSLLWTRTAFAGCVIFTIVIANAIWGDLQYGIDDAQSVSVFYCYVAMVASVPLAAGLRFTIDAIRSGRAAAKQPYAPTCESSSPTTTASTLQASRPSMQP